jgi:SHAQKYF class myb-like DNA-binding protein
MRSPPVKIELGGEARGADDKSNASLSSGGSSKSGAGNGAAKTAAGGGGVSAGAAAQSAEVAAAALSGASKRKGGGRASARRVGRGGEAGANPSVPVAGSVPAVVGAASAVPAGAGEAAASAAPVATAGVLKRKASAMSGDAAKEDESSDPPAPVDAVRKKRFAWTDELHRLFMASIFDVGLRQAKPKIILQNMGECPEELTTEHIKSHLQKYRANSKKTKDLFLKQFEIARMEAAASSDGKAINPGFHAYPMPAGLQHVLHPELVSASLLTGEGMRVASYPAHTIFPGSREAQLYSLGQPSPPGLPLQGLPHAPPMLSQQHTGGRFDHVAAARESTPVPDGLGAGGRSLLHGGSQHHHHHAHAHHHPHELAPGNEEAAHNGGRAPHFAVSQAPQLYSQMELQMRIHKEFNEIHDSRLGARGLPKPPPLPAALRAAAHIQQQQQQQHAHHLHQVHQQHLEEQAIAHAREREEASSSSSSLSSSSSSSSSSSAAAGAPFAEDAPTGAQQQFDNVETNFYESAPQQNVHMSPLITSSATTHVDQQPFLDLEGPLDDGELFGFLH